jgi:tRNA(Ile)-lysidine synthase
VADGSAPSQHGSATVASHSISQAFARVLDHRLERARAAPLVVAFSGGGDSLALLLLARAWATQNARCLVAVTVDHRLQAGSAAWAQWCRRRAESLGLDHRILAWTAERPASGLAAAARAARHGLLAQAARGLGAGVILMGHTADDCLEAAEMRARGARVAAPRQWAPSPVWPQGRGVFVLRPLLGERRKDLRAFLAMRGQSWIEDPANVDQAQSRARARRALAGGGEAASEAGRPDAGSLMFALREGAGGELSLAAQSLADAAEPASRAFVSAAVVCASGGDRPPRGEGLVRLMRTLTARRDFVTNLGGVRVQSQAGLVRFTREVGDMRRDGVAAQSLPVGGEVIWDGRFALRAGVSGMIVRPLDGIAARLCPGERRALRRASVAARRALFAIVDAREKVSCPILAEDRRVGARSLVMPRLAAALGVVQTEAAIWRVAEGRSGAYMEGSPGEKAS